MSHPRTPLLYNYFSRWVKDSPGKIALVEYSTGHQSMFRPLSQAVDLTTYRLLGMGIKGGDRVCALMHHGRAYVVLMFACFRIGAVFAPLDPDRYTQPDELARRLQQYAPHLLVTTPAHAALMNACGESMPRPLVMGTLPVEGLSVFNPFHPSSMFLRAWLARRHQPQLHRLQADLHRWSPAMLLPGDGDKAVLLSQENLLHQVQLVQHITRLKQYHKFLLALPSDHVGGITMGLLSPLLHGATVAILSRFEPEACLSALHKHRISHMLQHAREYQALWETGPEADEAYESLQFAMYQGATTPDFVERMQEFVAESGTGLCRAEGAGFVSYWPTQGWASSSLHPLGQGVGSLSKLTVRAPRQASGVAGDPLPEGMAGTLCVHSPAVFLGYLGDEAATSQSLTKEGFWYTGIRAVCHPEAHTISEIQEAAPHSAAMPPPLVLV